MESHNKLQEATTSDDRAEDNNNFSALCKSTILQHGDLDTPPQVSKYLIAVAQQSNREPILWQTLAAELLYAASHTATPQMQSSAKMKC